MPGALNSRRAVVLAATIVWLTPHAVAAQEPPGSDSASAWSGYGDDGGRMLRGVVDTAGAMSRAAASTEDAPAPEPGGGNGGPSACVWVPQGPLDQVAAAQAAVNAAQMPTVDDPKVDEAVVNAGGVGEIPYSTTWYRVTGTTAQVLHTEVCNGVSRRSQFLDLVPDGGGGLVVQISAQDLVPGAYAQVVRRLPTPVPSIGPADEDEDGYAYVNNPTFFWVERSAGQWAPVSGTASAGGISVTVQATPVRLLVDPGDGSEPVRCDWFRTVRRGDVTAGADGAIDVAGACVHRYLDSSSMSPNGKTWPVTVSIVWHATWTASTGQGGELGWVTTSAPPRDLAVAEIQAVIVDPHAN